MNVLMAIANGVLAVVLSSSVNHSFWWGVLHFFLSEVYVLYWMVVYTNAIEIIKGSS